MALVVGRYKGLFTRKSHISRGQSTQQQQHIFSKLHISLDRMLQGNKNHVSHCRMPPWQPLDIVKKTNLDNKQHHTNRHKRKFLMLWNVQSGVDAIHAETCKVLNEEGLPAPSAAQLDFSKGNVKARTRMIAQYEIVRSWRLCYQQLWRTQSLCQQSNLTFIQAKKRCKIAGTIAPFGKKSGYIFSRVVGTNNQRSY
jgi:hypothetical protein